MPHTNPGAEHASWTCFCITCTASAVWLCVQYAGFCTYGWQCHPLAVLQEAQPVGHRHNDVGGVACSNMVDRVHVSTKLLLQAAAHHVCWSLPCGCSVLGCKVLRVLPEPMRAFVEGRCSTAAACAHSPTNSSIDQMLAAVNSAVKKGIGSAPVASAK
jgi:hypothetical protein